MFEIFNNTNDKIEELDILNDYVEYLVKKEELENAVFNIIFVSDEEIHRINKEYRNVDRKTDVISFALEDVKDALKNLGYKAQEIKKVELRKLLEEERNKSLK